jgi:hypothetical protein
MSLITSLLSKITLIKGCRIICWRTLELYKLQDIVERTSNDVNMLVKHFQMVQTQIDQLTKVQKDLLVNASREKHACEISTRSGAST